MELAQKLNRQTKNLRKELIIGQEGVELAWPTTYGNASVETPLHKVQAPQKFFVSWALERNGMIKGMKHWNFDKTRKIPQINNEHRCRCEQANFLHRNCTRRSHGPPPSITNQSPASIILTPRFPFQRANNPLTWPEFEQLLRRQLLQYRWESSVSMVLEFVRPEAGDGRPFWPSTGQTLAPFSLTFNQFCLRMEPPSTAFNFYKFRLPCLLSGTSALNRLEDQE